MIDRIFALSNLLNNCTSGGDQLTNVPCVQADSHALQTVLSLLFGILGAITVLIIVIQGIKFSTSQGDPQKAADARKAIIYAIVGLAVSLSAEVVVNVVIGRL